MDILNTITYEKLQEINKAVDTAIEYELKRRNELMIRGALKRGDKYLSKSDKYYYIKGEIGDELFTELDNITKDCIVKKVIDEFFFEDRLNDVKKQKK